MLKKILFLPICISTLWGTHEDIVTWNNHSSRSLSCRVMDIMSKATFWKKHLESELTSNLSKPPQEKRLSSSAANKQHPFQHLVDDTFGIILQYLSGKELKDLFKEDDSQDIKKFKEAFCKKVARHLIARPQDYEPLVTVKKIQQEHKLNPTNNSLATEYSPILKENLKYLPVAINTLQRDKEVTEKYFKNYHGIVGINNVLNTITSIPFSTSINKLKWVELTHKGELEHIARSFPNLKILQLDKVSNSTLNKTGFTNISSLNSLRDLNIQSKYLSQGLLTPSNFSKLFKAYPDITKLHLKNIYTEWTELKKQPLYSLKVLILSGIPITSTDLEAITLIFPNLEQLELTDCKIDWVSLDLTLFQKFIHLSFLKLHDYDSVTPDNDIINLLPNVEIERETLDRMAEIDSAYINKLLLSHFYKSLYKK